MTAYKGPAVVAIAGREINGAAELQVDHEPGGQTHLKGWSGTVTTTAWPLHRLPDGPVTISLENGRMAEAYMQALRRNTRKRGDDGGWAVYEPTDFVIELTGIGPAPFGGDS